MGVVSFFFSFGWNVEKYVFLFANWRRRSYQSERHDRGI